MALIRFPSSSAPKSVRTREGWMLNRRIRLVVGKIGGR
jgi:hypothetical protein